MATTDLHMQLLAYDYFADRTDGSLGLIGLAPRIAALRAEGLTTLLFDNGDLIQGNPLADHVADRLPAGDPHPMIAALKHLQYDAVTLGNHDFDYGVPFLQDCLRPLDCPVVSANIRTAHAGALSQRFAILRRDIPCADGQRRGLRIGVTGFGPPQIADWDETQRGGSVAVTDIVSAAQAIVPQMTAAGADIIVALAHSGIGAAQHTPRMENAVIPLAKVPGIDLIVAGHTHDSFPNPDRAATDAIDPAAGTIHGTPVVMAAAHGRALGVVDLSLMQEDGHWRISGHDIRLDHPVGTATRQTPLQDTLHDLVADAHQATLVKMRKPIAQTPALIHSYFATITPDLPQQILAQAMRAAAHSTLTDLSDTTPLLVATAPFRFGGDSGLGSYIAIQPGPITLHDVAAMFPFNDRLQLVRRTGAQLRDWLERAASHYNQVAPGSSDTPLINPQSAGYTCDTLHGLRYDIDLTARPRFDPTGTLINSDARRISALCYQGQPVRENDSFIVATNSFRSAGGGGFAPIPKTDLVPVARQRIRDLLLAQLQSGVTRDSSIKPVWRFTPQPGSTATFISASAAKAQLPDNIAALAPIDSTRTRYRITL